MNGKAVAPATVKDLFKRTVSLDRPHSPRPRFPQGGAPLFQGCQGCSSRPPALHEPLVLVSLGLYKTGCVTTRRSIHRSVAARACVRRPRTTSIDRRARSRPAFLSLLVSIDAAPTSSRIDSMAAMAATDSITRRFAVACGVLSQYVKAGAPAAAGGSAAVAPFVKLPGGAAVQEGGGSGANAQQLTIFYGGRVVVLDSCPPEKAAELIRLAAGAAAQQGAPEQAPAPAPAPVLVDMPIARKASLRRFLSKRKDRATAPGPAPAPYERKDEEPEPAAKKGKVETSREEAASWLALGSLGPMHSR